jgi:hypothetical protein
VPFPQVPEFALQLEKDPQSETTQFSGHGITQVFVSVKLGQRAPPFKGCFSILLFLVCVPFPQVPEFALQLEKDPQSETTQFSGHGILQFCVSIKLGQGTPPFKGCFSILLLLVCVPFPQVPEFALQFEKGPQSETTQFSGHGILHI